MKRTGFVWNEKFAWFELGNYAGSVLAHSYSMQPDQHVYDPEVVRRFRNLVDVSGLLNERKRWLIYADLGFSEPRDPDRAV